MPFRIKLLPPDIDAEARARYTNDISGTIIDPDVAIEDFQTKTGIFFPAHEVLALSTGTAALHLGLLVLGVQKDDYVICPTFTFAATINAVLHAQAIPLLVDSEEQSWNMDPRLLEEAITFCIKKGRKPAAILLVHSYGTPAKVEEISEIAARCEIPILEDAAPAFGAEFKGRMLGTFGTCGIFSFNYNKIITTGGGGLLISKDGALISKAQHLANQARVQAPFYLHDSMGFNYRMSGLSAALGVAQLPAFSQKLHRKKQIFNNYKNELKEKPGIFFQAFPKGASPNFWLTSVLFAGQTEMQKAFNLLRDSGIECRRLWNPMHLQPAFRHYPSFVKGVSEMLFKQGLSLPSGVSLKDEEQEEIIWKLKSFL